MSRKKIRRLDCRVVTNPVTHEREATVLDAVQLTLERLVGQIDGAMLRITSTADRDRLARRLMDRIAEMRHPPEVLPVAPDAPQPPNDSAGGETD